MLYDSRAGLGMFQFICTAYSVVVKTISKNIDSLIVYNTYVSDWTDIAKKLHLCTGCSEVTCVAKSSV